MPNAVTLESSISNVLSLLCPSRRSSDVNFALKAKFISSVTAPANQEEEQTISYTDHSGSYARSYGGARYSQVFLAGGYLWAFRMNKKTGHYVVTPRVFLDSQALSGRPVQIFHSDGDGVFSSQETIDLLAKEKVRHEYSALYD